MTKDLFIVHPSVFHDAFRTDYDTQFRQSSKDFFDLLLKENKLKGYKIATTSGEVFQKLLKTDLGNSESIWIIPESLVDIDYKTWVEQNQLKPEKSIIQLASRKVINNIPFIIATKSKDKIMEALDGAMITIYTPKEAIELYNQNPERF